MGFYKSKIICLGVPNVMIIESHYLRESLTFGLKTNINLQIVGSKFTQNIYVLLFIFKTYPQTLSIPVRLVKERPCLEGGQGQRAPQRPPLARATHGIFLPWPRVNIQ